MFNTCDLERSIVQVNPPVPSRDYGGANSNEMHRIVHTADSGLTSNPFAKPWRILGTGFVHYNLVINLPSGKISIKDEDCRLALCIFPLLPIEER